LLKRLKGCLRGAAVLDEKGTNHSSMMDVNVDGEKNLGWPLPVDVGKITLLATKPLHLFEMGICGRIRRI
jgi:hypothetical protein